MRRIVFFFAGVLVGIGVRGGLGLAAPEEKKPPSFALVTAFQPEPPWTREMATHSVHKLKADYDAKRPKGFELKYFLGDFHRNEFGGVYLFATREEMEAFLKLYPPAPNRSVKRYEILDTWKPASESTRESDDDAHPPGDVGP